MDSSNSGSMQSSSAGDEEYDSRGAESISAFLSPTYQTGQVSPFTNPPPPQQPPAPPPHPSSSSIFDPVLCNYFDPILRSPPNPLLNLDTVWPKSLRSDPTNCTGINQLMASSSTSSDQPRHLQAQPARQDNPTPRGSSSTDHHSHQQNPQQQQQTGARNPKKRSRASRRAPTTVLTTDTTNFRAMVQEFTGIPAPPFTPRSPCRTRFDLFGSPGGGSASAATIRGGGNSPLDPLQAPPYLLRPFAQKIQIQPSLPILPFVSSSTLSSFPIASSPNSATSNDTTTTTGIRATSVPGGSGAGGANSNLLNMQNPILAFQPLLQHPLSIKYGPPNSDVNFGSPRTPGSLGILRMSDSHLKTGLVDEFGLGQVHLGGLSSLVPQPASRSENDNCRNDNSNNNPASWADELGLNDGGQGQSQSRSVNGGSGRVGGLSTVSFPPAASNVSGARGEGMVESWICSTD
ncbi:hypothetical protein Ancab_003392 [Ancistrocladus abbreviatus]